METAQLTPEERLERKRAQDRIRQQRYYASKKEEILERKKTSKSLAKTEDIPTGPHFSNPNEITLAALAKREMNANTKKFYRTALITIAKVLATEDIGSYCKYANRTIKILKKTKQADGTEYSVTTHLGWMRTLLFCFDNGLIKSPSPKQMAVYQVAYQDTKIISDDRQLAIKTEKTIINFADYKALVIQHFGTKSKQNMISQLYYFYCARDDFGCLKIVEKMAETDDATYNYLVVPKKKSSCCRIVLNHFKTVNQFGKQNELLAKPISNMLREYIERNNIKLGDFLFGKEATLTNFISKMNKEMGISEDVDGAVSNFRKMKISEIFEDGKITNKERIQLSNVMMHTPITQLKYIRNLIKHPILPPL
jgi:hypothetical protein